MKLKSLGVLLLAGVWGVGSWWWYTCKIKGFCGAEHAATAETAAVAGAAGAGMAGLANTADNAAKATTGALDATAQAAADAAKATADAAAKTAADAAKATADAAAKTAADAAKATADAAVKTAADAAKATEDAAKTAADTAKATADATAKAAADATKVTMETNKDAPDTGTGIDPAVMHFPSGSSNPQLSDDTKAYFKKVVQFLKDNNGAKVTIVGHTDNKGDAAKNKALGLKRAEMLQKMLVDLGAPKGSVSASSEGQDKPIADNATEAGRTKNRRVEVTPTK